MKSPLHQKLYDSTTQEHLNVEEIIGFKNGFSTPKLMRFYKSILACRQRYQYGLQAIEGPKIDRLLLNTSFISALKTDLMVMGAISLDTHRKGKENHSFSVGVFYVLAGSAMGARVIKKMALEVDSNFKSHYLELLISSSKEQMILLHDLLTTNELNESALIKGAKEAFDFICQTAKIEYKKEHSTF